MRLAALFSGGKDSTYSAYLARLGGDSVECLVTIAPRSDESMLLHFPNISVTKLQSRAMGIPQIYAESGVSAESEEALLASTLQKARDDYGIEGAVHGGISSEFQRRKFDAACEAAGLRPVSPVWHMEQKQYMKNLIRDKFRIMITGVSAGGIDDAWLGREITAESLELLEGLAEKFGFNLNFEGGEAETLVLDCPLFSRQVSVIRSRKVWDGYRGRFEIEEAELG